MTGNVIPFPVNPQEAAALQSNARFQAIHFNREELDDLAAGLGTPEEWLTAAVMHLKAQMCEARGRSVVVSSAALSLLLVRFEELEHGGEPWPGNAA